MLLFCLLVETGQRAFALYITGIVFVVFSMLTMTESFVKKLYVTIGVHSKQGLIELVNKAR